MQWKQYGRILRRIGKKYRKVLILVLVGLLLLTLPDFGKTKPTKSETEKAESNFDLEGFERRLERVLERGEGVGRVEVVLAIQSGMERVYAEEKKLNTRQQKEDGETKDYNQDSDRRPSIISTGSGVQTPVLIKEIYPEFLGATIVCDGARNPTVQMYVIDAVAALTGLTSDHITVIPMKS